MMNSEWGGRAERRAASAEGAENSGQKAYERTQVRMYEEARGSRMRNGDGELSGERREKRRNTEYPKGYSHGE